MAKAEDRVEMVAEDPSVIDYCAAAADRLDADAAALAALREQLAEAQRENRRLTDEIMAIIAPTEVGGGVVAHLKQKLDDANHAVELLTKADEAAVYLFHKLEEADQKLERHIKQAHDISHLLSEAGIGPCPIPEGVHQLLTRAESSERELAALKAQGCETCAHQGLRLTPDIYCALHEDMAARFGNRCGRWTPVAPTPEG
jgi:chromosome segregation ATPase